MKAMNSDLERVKKYLINQVEIVQAFLVIRIFLSKEDFRLRRDFFDFVVEVFFEEEINITGKKNEIFRKIIGSFIKKEKTSASINFPIKSGFIMGGEEAPVGRRVELSFVQKGNRDGIFITVSGQPAVQGRNGRLGEAFLKLNPMPGVVGKDGKFDFRKIFRFPRVENGQKIVEIFQATRGKVGITYDGKPDFCKVFFDYPIEIGKGIRKEDFSRESGETGYSLFAETGGVIVCQSDEAGKVNFISIESKIVIENVNFSVGDLDGNENGVFPAEVVVEKVLGRGFTINSKEKIFVQDSEGGIMLSEKDVEVAQLFPGSKIFAKENVFCRKSMGSRIEAGKKVFFQGDCMDTEIFSSELDFERREGGSYIRNMMAKIQIGGKIVGVKFSSSSTISFGEELFIRKEQLLGEKFEFSKTIIDLEKHKIETSKLLGSLIGKIGEKLEASDPRKKEFASKTMIQVLEKPDYFQNSFNPGDIFNVKKTFAELKKVAVEIKVAQEKLRGLEKEEADIKEKIATMSLQITDSKLNNGGNLVIQTKFTNFCFDQDDQQKGALIDINLSYDKDLNQVVLKKNKLVNVRVREKWNN